MIEAAIFDMDGLLIDSEPFWREAEIKSFQSVGIYLDTGMCLQTMGLRVDQVIDYWDYKFPGNIKDRNILADTIVGNVISLVNEKGKAREGVQEILAYMKSKKVKIALASSSPLNLIRAVTSSLKISDFFEGLYSAEREEYGKPHPGVYITTVKMLNTVPERCLAFEDSFNGLLSAKAARMKCVCVPDDSIKASPKLAIADLVLDSLKDFKPEHWAMLAQ